MSAKIKTPGQQLKAAREELGKSQSDMAKITRISIQQLQGLEEDRYESIPAPMYVRGFIKLYAQKLGLSHEPLVDLYERMRKGEPLQDEPEAPAPVAEVAPDEAVPQAFHRAQAPQHPQAPQVVPQKAVPYAAMETNPEPEIFNENFATPSSDASRIDWQSWLSKIPDPREWFQSDWMKKPELRYGLSAVVLLFVLVGGIRGCRSETEEEASSLTVEDPYLRPPEPVYFQLPSSYQ
ncbi:helix-turn-helix domain-containing protein [Kiritimatiellota bacterium B12222]|nr:helix-turn-helix domain-containing protein [Kiritimatiellota bacterium B12222]